MNPVVLPEAPAVIHLASDTMAACCPQIAQALYQQSLLLTAPSYGTDAETVAAQQALRQVLEAPQAEIFPLVSGTAANALALSAMTPPWGTVYCHQAAHVLVDECGAVEQLSGGARLHPLPGAHGKITADVLDMHLVTAAAGSVHQMPAAAVSLTQATESGTVYSVGEIAALAEVCHDHGLLLHMDGARFANALATLGCSAAEMTWKAGVDVLSFGASKNGAWAAEAVVFFDPALAGGFAYRRKRSGHLVAKGRFIGAQLRAYLQDDLWLTNARHANALAQLLGQAFADAGMPPVWPVQANEVFVLLTPVVEACLRRIGVEWAPWSTESGDGDMARFVTSWATSEADILLIAEALHRLSREG